MLLCCINYTLMNTKYTYIYIYYMYIDIYIYLLDYPKP